MLADSGITPWILGIAAGVIVGLAKTGLPGCGILAVPLMAMIFPAKLSVGALLPVLIAGDICAVAYYHRHTQWKKILELFPCVLGGIAIGALALWKINSAQLKPALGGLILILLALEFVRRVRNWNEFPHKSWFVVLMGSLSGFATTLGNVAGPVMNIYFISKGFKKAEFMGTTAWYFLIFNCLKVPIYAKLDMMNRATLTFDLMLVPAVLAGAFLGRHVMRLIPQDVFNVVILLLAAAGAVRLLF